MPSNPDFIIIGAPRCATTSLFNTLEEHPDVFTTNPKEPNFFAIDGEINKDHPAPIDRWIKQSVSNIEDYRQLYKDARPSQITGEASVCYLSNPHVPLRIKKENPNAKLIAVLRNPIERAYSHYQLHQTTSPYLHYCKKSKKILSFSEYFSNEEKILNGLTEETITYTFLGYKRQGNYFSDLSNYLSHFAKDQILILLYEDLIKEPQQTIGQIFKFLNINDLDLKLKKNYSPHKSIHKESPPLSSKLLTSIFRNPTGMRAAKLVTSKNLHNELYLRAHKAPPQSAPSTSELKQLGSYYKEDTLKLQKLINRNLENWIN